MKLDKGILRDEIRKHRRLISHAFYYKLRSELLHAETIGKDISLAVAEFKCQRPDCRKENNLQFHHLINFHCSYYMDEWRYMTQRVFWGNIIVLCESCHQRFHNNKNKVLTDMQVKNGNSIHISPERYERVKKKFFIEQQAQEIISEVANSEKGIQQDNPSGSTD